MVHLTYTDRSDIVDFIVKRPWRDRSLERRYAPYFSKKLQAAWALAEKEAVEKECGGQYIKGDICGLDFSPLSCAQDHSTIGYTYRTLRAGATSAEIEMSWAERSDELTATYWMIRRNGRWIMDGVLCRWGEKFHWPDDELRPERKGSSGDQKPDATP